jgi:hypothetical protein
MKKPCCYSRTRNAAAVAAGGKHVRSAGFSPFDSRARASVGDRKYITMACGALFSKANINAHARTEEQIARDPDLYVSPMSPLRQADYVARVSLARTYKTLERDVSRSAREWQGFAPRRFVFLAAIRVLVGGLLHAVAGHREGSAGRAGSRTAFRKMTRFIVLIICKTGSSPTHSNIYFFHRLKVN